MKRIGFIDYYIDEWHAHHYPQWIRESQLADEFELHCAWEQAPKSGGIDLAAWCARYGVRPADSIGEVVETCDAIVVLSPDNPEMHEQLCEVPLSSGKPVYVDKTFAPDRATAQRIVAAAEAGSTPFFSSSALRFAAPLEEASRAMPDGVRAEYVRTVGGGNFANYLVHQLEMIVAATGGGVSGVRFGGTENAPTLWLRFQDGRHADLAVIADHPFDLTIVRSDAQVVHACALDDFFPPFINAMLRFFLTGDAPVPVGQTVEIMAIIEAARSAQRSPDTWQPV